MYEEETDTKKVGLIAGLVVLIGLFLASSKTIAGDATPINFGNTVLGSIDPIGDTDTYTFSANAGDTVLIRMSEASISLYPEVRLYAPDGSELGWVWHATTAEKSYTLADAGEYTVLASDHYGTNTGDYGIFVQRLNNPGNATAINFGQTISGSIDSAAETDTYTFSANAGDTVLVRMSEASISLYPEVKLYAPDGSELGWVWHASTAERSYTLADAGEYTVLALDFYGTNTGNYSISVQRLNNPGNATAINFGQTISSSIDSDAEMDTYTFSANAGDTVLVRMSEASISLYPEVRLYAPDGSELGWVWHASTAERSYTLADAGEYTVLALDYYGTNTGNYSIFVQRLNNPGNATAINFGDTIPGSIASVGEMDTYTFSANPGDTVLVRMSESSVFLNPEVRLYAPDGSELGWVWDTTTAERSYTLAEDGEYTVLAFDHYGTKTGDYGIFVQRLNNPGNATAVNFGDTIPGSIDSVAEMDTYTFSANAGDSIVVRMSRGSGFLDPHIRLYAPDGTELAGGYYYGDSIAILHILVADGQYTVLACDHMGNDTGNYGIFVQRLKNPGNATAITFGDTISSFIDSIAEVDTYTFSANAGDSILIRMSRGSGFLDPHIRLYAPDGTELAAEYYYGDAVEISYILADDGQYTFLACDHMGNDTGDYGIFIQRLNNPGNATAVNFGDTTSGSIDSIAEMDTYTFSANAGDSIIVRMSRGSGFLDPHIRLYAPDGTELAGGYYYGDSIAILHILVADGQYTVLACDHMGNDTGNYGIFIQRLNNPGNATAITFGDTISSFIDSIAEVDTYTFSANAGDSILIRMSRGSVFLDPHIRLYAPDGTELAAVNNYAKTVEISYILANDGQYTFLACDYMGNDTGDYGIFVQRLNNPGNATTINFGQTISGSIDSVAEMDTYTFSANADDTVIVRMSEASIYLHPEVRLYAPNGMELGRVWNITTAEISYTLADAGEYTVLASDHYGTTTGDYTLSLGMQISEQLTPGEPYFGIISSGDWHVFYMDVEAGKHLLVTLEPALSTGRLELYGRYDQIPTQSTYDYAARTRNASGNYELLISTTESGRYYFAVYARDISTSMGYTLTASLVSRHVSNVYPRVVVQSENVSIHILGIGFTTGMQVELQTAEGAPIVAKAVVLSSPTMIVAYFNLSSAPLGFYDVAIIWPDGHRVEIPGALEVRELKQGALIEVPDLKLSEGETFTLDVEVPETQNLFVTLQKTTLVSYGNSWRGQMFLLRDGAVVASTSGSHDLILHIVDPVPGSYKISVTADQAGEGILTAWTALPELSLGQWTVGTIYCSYGSVWYQVDVPPGQDQLLFEAEAMGFGSHFDIYLGQYGSPDHWVSRHGTRISLEIPNPEPGIYIVEFLDSAMIRGDSGWAADQSRDVLLKADTVVTTDPDPDYVPTITSISPDKGGNTGFVTVTIEGGWLDPNATVSLVRGGQPVITAMSVYGEPDQTTLTAAFDLEDEEPGQCSLVVTNSDGQTATSPIPFVIEQGGEPELWVEIVGREKIRVGRTSKYVIRYGNSGNVNARYPYLIIALPTDIDYDIEGNFSTIPPDEDSPPISPDPEALNVTVLCLPELPPGSVRSITVNVNAPVSGEWKIMAYITSDQSVIYTSMLSFAEPLFDELIKESNNVSSQVTKAESLSTEDEEEVNFPHKDMSDSPPADYIMFWSDGSYWHTAKSLGNGDFIEIMPDNDPDNPDINVENLKNNPYPGWEYWGAYRLPGDIPSEEELRGRVQRLREKYGIDPGEPKKSEYDSDYCSSEFKKDELIRTFCWGLVFALNYDTIYLENKWIGYETVYDNIKLDSDPTWYDKVGSPGWWPQTYMEKDHPCFKDIVEGIEKVFRSVASTTPEDKYGPVGYDVPGTPIGERKRFVNADRDHYFRVDFWNKEDATAPAYDVLVEDQLDSNMDWSSFRFEDTGFLKWNVDLRPCQYFNVDVDTRPDMDWIVNVEGTFDPEKGKVTWWFRTLDPDTHETSDDPMAGFLPPITESGEEIGWVGFTVRSKAGLATGTQIANQAFVEFDHAGDLYDHPAPKEGPWTNTLDAEGPASQVSPLPEFTETRSFLVEWNGQDDLNGSGIQGYDIYVSTDSSDYVLWLANTDDTSGTFIGEGGHTYSFYSRARDNVGHVEPAPDSPDSTTTSVWITGDFCGVNSGPPDGYVDYWDLLYFARCWHTRPGDNNWDPICDLAKEDDYVDYWDLLVFARHWHEGQKP